MRTVPVILVLTKLDIVVSDVLSKIDSDDVQQFELARAKALQMCEDSCRRHFDKGLEEVPAEIVSGEPRFADLVENLVVSTDRFILGSRGSSAGFGVREEQTRVSAVPLAWAAALRVSHNIVLQTSIEVGRSRYWKHLQFSVHFADRTLQSCVDVIHEDLVEVWNLNDRDKARYLSSDAFKARISHLVQDLVGPAGVVSDLYPTQAAGKVWVCDVYRARCPFQHNLRWFPEQFPVGPRKPCQFWQQGQDSPRYP
ncbi:hypothetical protein EI94DRAFT_293866 [Lactarius quietus]|nr:hypothetical protein EI94DRAFT_169854 [Lactarius quietus]KAF8272438.1 hypothetical protein EI94DRAFT_293866 [Lactarius quietus]